MKYLLNKKQFSFFKFLLNNNIKYSAGAFEAEVLIFYTSSSSSSLSFPSVKSMTFVIVRSNVLFLLNLSLF